MNEEDRVRLRQALEENDVKDLDIDARIRLCNDEGDALELEKDEYMEQHDVKYRAHRKKLNALYKEERDLRGASDHIRHRLNYDIK